MTENKNDIPKHWKVKKLGEVCTYTKGKKPSLLNSHKTKDCSIPYINIKAFEKGIYDEYTNGIKCNLCEDGDLLMVWDGARCGLIGKAKKGAVGSTLMKILPIDELDEEYLYHFIASKFHTINTNPKGVGIPHVEPNLLWNFYIPIPPLSEQKAIVEKIEELFSELDKGVEDLKTVQNQLKIYRQSLLKWAFEGKLTNDNVEEGNLPKGWRRTDLVNVAEIQRGRSKHRPRNDKSLYGGVYPFVQTGDIRDAAGGYIKNHTQTYNETGLQQSRLWKKGTLCITIAANIGDTAILDFDACFPDSIVGIVPLKDVVLNKFVNYFFVSYKQRLEELAPATAQKNINVAILEKISIPIPSLTEQQRIVEILEEKLSVCDQMEQTIIQSLQQAESLRQSILKQAFEGKLVTIQEEVPVYTPKKIPFYQAQLFAYIIDTSANNNIDLGEMTLAKNSYLIDKIYGVPTYFDYARGYLGPYSIQMKSVLYGGSLKQFFKKGEFHIELQNSDKLFKYTNPYESQTREAMEDLSSIISQYEDKERSYQTELLATVCKVIEDIQTTDLKAVRASMKEWEIDLKTTKHKNKAEKFSESDTASCLNFIISKGWDKKLIK